ncbi:MAG TPA: YbaK/EbsC family protein [Candidatus Dormibacteraeota bacterium]|nr:YbaK/EbsC family protein [Candidatus Dormibacteraeota bacterium]
MDSDVHRYSEGLERFLVSNNIWHRFIEFDDPVKTVKQAEEKVDVERIVKSIVLVDSNNQPLIAILRANDRVSYKKLKALLEVNDVRLANEKEVLEYSGYPVGGVPPFNQIKRSYLDGRVTRITNVIAGDVNKLVELRCKDICDLLNPVITDLIV